MARIVRIEELPELGLVEPNLTHIQESYQRQIIHSRPLTAKKKTKAEVSATGAKWFRQKGTGRARQGELANPHMEGGGLAFPPRPRTPSRGLNKQIRQSALRSAVLLHVQQGSAHVVQGADFEQLEKTREVAKLLAGVSSFETVLLVAKREHTVWRAADNIWNLRLVTPQFVNVRDLVESRHLVFTQSALEEYRQLLRAHLVIEDFTPAEGGDEPAEPGTPGGEQ